MIEIKGSVIAFESISGELLEEPSLQGEVSTETEVQGMPFLYYGYIVMSAEILDGDLILELADGSKVNIGHVQGEDFKYEDFTLEQLLALVGPPGQDAPIDYAYTDEEIEMLVF